MNVYSFETFDRSCIECVINLQFQVWTSIIIFLKTHHINSSESLRLGYAIVGVVLDGVQTMQQRWWLLVVTCGECLCLVMGKCGTVWRLWCGPSPAQPCQTIPSNPARALVNAVGELLATSSLLPSHWLTVHYLLGHTPLLSSHLLKTIINCHLKIQN